MNDGFRKIDFTIAYKEDTNESKEGQRNELDERRRFFEDNLENEGLELEMDRMYQNGESVVFIKVHAPWKTLCRYGEELQIKTPLWVHDKPLLRRNSMSDQTSFWDKLCCQESAAAKSDKKTRLYGKSTIINWPFKRKRIDRYAVRDQKTYFTDKQRIEIVYEILQKVPCNPKELKQRGIEVLIKEKVYETAYALHDSDIIGGAVDVSDMTRLSNRQKLHETWANWKAICNRQPLMDVRNYFGEKIAFYYGFMDVYTRMLIFPSIVGLVTFIIGLISTAYNQEVDEICQKFNPSSSSNGDDAIYEVSVLIMCPICAPPGCEHWGMIPDGCFQYQWAFRLDNPCSFVLSGFTTLWAIVFLKLWKRREAYLAAEWGTEDAEEQDIVIRPEYEKRAPSQRRNPITLEIEPYVPLLKIYIWLSWSIFATLMVLVFACLCLVALVISRISLYGALRHIVDNKNIECSRWLTHGMLFISVTILEKAFYFIAEKLTDYECPRTDKQFMNSLLWKVFIFQFLNDFIPIGYAAWIKGRTVQTPLDLGWIDELCDGGCMGEVTELVAVLLLCRLVIGNATEIGVPLVQNAWKRFRMQKQVEDNVIVPQYVKDFHLNEVEYDGVFEDYMEMMVQFMFIVLFIPALPVAPFVCFLNNVAEIRVDGIKMLQTNRRPVPIRTSGIGIWNKFLDIISKSGVICNAALLAFTSDNIPKLYYMFVYNPGQGTLGFTRFSLSKVQTADFAVEPNEMLLANHTECYYPDYRNPYKPFAVKDFYWQIYTIRLVVFSAYCVVFFVIMWLINTFVSDVPESVRTKIKRKQYVVSKAVEAESAIKQTKWGKDGVWPLNNV